MSVQEVILPALTRPDAWGIHAELQGIAACLQAGGVETTFQELMVVTGTAFRTHAFAIDDNPGMRLGPDPSDPNAIWAPRYTWTSLRHNNYGHVESAAFYYGGEVHEVTGIDVLKFWQVVRFEVDAGRPLVLYGHRPHRAELIVGYRLERSPLRQVVHLQGEDGLMSLELPPPSEYDRARGKIEVLTTDGAIHVPRAYRDNLARPIMPGEHLLLVRPGPRVDYRGSDADRIRDAMRWGVEHGSNRKELVHETSRFYATGLRAMEVWATFLEEGVPQELASPSSTAPDPLGDVALHTTVTAREWARARTSAAIWLRARGEVVLQSPTAHAIADAYERAATALTGVLELFDGSDEVQRAAIRDDGLRRLAATRVREAAAAEREALRLLADALQREIN